MAASIRAAPRVTARVVSGRLKAEDHGVHPEGFVPV